MKTAFQKLFTVLAKLWRTVVRMFCKDRIYFKDVDSDTVPELVIDFNGTKDNHSEDVNENNNKNKEE